MLPLDISSHRGCRRSMLAGRGARNEVKAEVTEGLALVVGD